MNSAAYSRDAASSSPPAWITPHRVWNADSGRLLATLTGHKDWIRSPRFPQWRDDRHASKDKTARIWSGPQWEARRRSSDTREPDLRAVFSADGRGVDRQRRSDPRRFRVSDGAGAWSLAGHGSGYATPSIRRDGKRILTASRDRTAVVWIRS